MVGVIVKRTEKQSNQRGSWNLVGIVKNQRGWVWRDSQSDVGHGFRCKGSLKLEGLSEIGGAHIEMKVPFQKLGGRESQGALSDREA